MKRLLTALAAAAITAAPALAQTVVVTNGRVVTNTDAGVIENGTVIVRDGDIVAVGAGLEIPAGARTIDAGGGWITPGLFHPQTQLGLVEVGAESMTRDTEADDSPFSAAISVADGFNFDGNHIDEARIDGITRFAIFPSVGRNNLAGRGALADSTGLPGSLFAAEQFLVIDMARSGAATSGGSKPAAWAYLRAAMNDARTYPGRYLSTQEGIVLNRTDAEAFEAAVRGEMPIVFLMDDDGDIRRLLAFKEENPSLRIIIAGAAEAHQVAEELAAADIPVIFDPMRNLPGSFDTLSSAMNAAAQLFDAGVEVAFTTLGSDIYFNPRLLTQHAGIARAHGAEWEDAFRAITLTPAELYGYGDRFGALAPGYAGDVVVWDGDPLEVMSAPTHVLIEGEVQSMETRQTRLRDRYREIRPEHAYAYHH
ncbi:amidohydrolase [Marinicauda algicola]|uniref:Amidohydrolase n=1 Tax=Marinicauda algicola TaxID=2029849 RepID=A0A4S2H1V9_9PROT|nr:amidohydrolase family protein [Marinicauda algicola]TGY89580.1 amidohydrolase [Marinicauda algicola]